MLNISISSIPPNLAYYLLHFLISRAKNLLKYKTFSHMYKEVTETLATRNPTLHKVPKATQAEITRRQLLNWDPKLSILHNSSRPTTIRLLLITIPLIFIYLQYRNIKSVKTLLPPGPPRLPFIGNLHQLGNAGNLHVYFWKLSQKYGPLMQIKMGSVPILVVSSAKLAEKVLKHTRFGIL